MDLRNYSFRGELLTVTSIQEHDVQTQKWPCCLNCLFWEKEGGCSKAQGAMPPPRIIVLGCQVWEGDIPF